MKKLFSILLAAMFFAGCSVIDETERGVVLSWGKYSETFGPGMHVINPLTDEVVKFPIRTELKTVTLDAGSNDLQTVTVTAQVNYHVDPMKVDVVYKNYGIEYVANILVPKINETITGVTPQYKAEDMLQKREEIRDRMRSTLRIKLDSAKAPIIIDGFALTSFEFSKEFKTSVEDKQVQEQKAQKETYITQQMEEQNKQKVNAARADSQAIAIRMKALSQHGGTAYLTLQFLEKWNGELPSVMSCDNKLMPMLNIGGK